MMQIAKIMPVNFRAAAAQQPLVSKPSEEKNADSNVSEKYLAKLDPKYNGLLDIKKNIIQKPRGSERNFRVSASSSQNGRNKSTLISR